MFEFTPTDKGLNIKITTKRFDATNTEKFKASLEEHCAEPMEEATIEMGDIEFIDSSGIGALLCVQKQMKETAGPVRLIDPQPAVESIIELLRLQRIFSLEKRTKTQ